MRFSRSIFAAATGLLWCCCLSSASENPKSSLTVGDVAPAFSAPDDTGKTWVSDKVVGQSVVVLFFYPADLSSACTRQACGFQRQLSALRDAGGTVVGVSGDSVSSHQLFKKVHSLDFPLLSDEEGTVADLFGVPVREGGQLNRVVDGEQRQLIRGVTAQRWTFVIGLDGRIVHRNTAVDIAGDSESVLKVVRQLASTRQ